jgi:hypothetical protein
VEPAVKPGRKRNMFLKLKHATGPIAINTFQIIAMSPNEVSGTDIVLSNDKDIVVENNFDSIWSRLQQLGEKDA